MNDIISIIIPTFNRAKYIPDAINSIIKQTYSKWECLIVDDGSTDNTEIILKELILRDERIKYYKRPPHVTKGANGCRNYGLTLCCGKFVGFCDDDDFWLPNKLELQMNVFSNYPDYGLVTGNIEFVNNDGKRTGRVIKQLDKNGYVFEDFLLKNRMSMITPLVKMEVFDKVGDFDVDYKLWEDWEFWRRAAYYYKFYALSEVLACVRRHDDNTYKILEINPIDDYFKYYRLTNSLLSWGEHRFTNEDRQLIELYEAKKYRQLLSNHYPRIKNKIKFLLIIFKNDFRGGVRLLKLIINNQS